VGNILVEESSFREAVSEQFTKLYPTPQRLRSEEVGEELLAVNEIRKGYDELQVPHHTSKEIMTQR
jgi:hypothetical protein